MILSDREIRAALTRGSIRLTPDPSEDKEGWTSTALDLRLHERLAYWAFPPGVEVSVRPAAADYDFNETLRTYGRSTVIPAEGQIIRPGHFCLGWTAERLQLPYRSRIAARVEGKSSLGRLGLGVHVTAPTIHAGFGVKPDQPAYPGSAIQLEIWNFGPVSVVLETGKNISTLVVEAVEAKLSLAKLSLRDILGPVHADLRQSGMPEAELDTLLEDSLEKARSERRSMSVMGNPGGGENG